MIILVKWKLSEFYLIDLAGMVVHLKDKMRILSPLFSDHLVKVLLYTKVFNNLAVFHQDLWSIGISLNHEDEIFKYLKTDIKKEIKE